MKKSKSKNKEMQQSNFLFYTAPDGEVKIEVFFYDENIWLTQKKMADLFNTTKQNISLHLKNIFEVSELDEKSVVKEYLTTAEDGKKYPTQFYNLDAIISVGYRINSERATKFRIWATKTLKEFIIKGFVLDDERLKNGRHFGMDYFDQLLERIREIRASERRFYQKITDIYSEASVDYDPNSEITKEFFATVQNKLHWAITGSTAAELVAKRANVNKPHMGLTAWKNSPKGKVLKSDVSIAKNYLDEKELSELNRIVSMYLDFAELQAERQKPMTMAEWAKRLDVFLKMYEYGILDNPGKVSAEMAKELAEKEFETFRIKQDKYYISDFDREVKKYIKPKKV